MMYSIEESKEEGTNRRSGLRSPLSISSPKSSVPNSAFGGRKPQAFIVGKQKI